MTGDDRPDAPKDHPGDRLPPDERATKPESVRVSAAVCPICGAPTHARYRPFCSKRCADVDLHRWLGGVYRVPAEEVPDPDILEDALRKTGDDE